MSAPGFAAVLPLPVVPVVTITNVDSAIRVAEAFCTAGLCQIEITFRTAAAPTALRDVVRRFPDMVVGAGTLLQPDQVAQAVDAGAAFGVAPGVNQRTMTAAREAGLPFLPGVATPGEIEMALEEGYLWQKIPGVLGNFEALLDWLHAAYAHTGLRLVPAGGVALEDLPRFLHNPIVGAMAGIWLTPPHLMRDGQWDEIRALAGNLVRLLQDAKPKARAL